jgi:hypothetical protein
MAEGNDHLGEIRNVCWNTLERLPELVYPPTVGQNMWWLLGDKGDMNLEKVTIQAEGDEGNAFSVLHMSGKVDYTIDSDVKSRIDIHNDIVRQVLLPSFTAQLGAAEMGQGESEDDDEAEKEDELPHGEEEVAVAGDNATVGVARPTRGEEPAGERGVDCAGSTPTVEGPAGSARPPPIEHTAASLLGLARLGTNTAGLGHELPAPAAELTVADVTKLLAAVKKRESETKKRQRELDDEELSSVAHLSKQLKVAKAERKQIRLERQKELAKAQAEGEGAAATDAEDWPEIAEGRRKPKAKPTSLDYWQLGNNCG